jgi:hypothetical protein
VRDVVSRAVARTRQQKVPALIEADTYRYRGHWMRDPAGAVYRTKEEVEREKLRDPIVLFRDKIPTAVFSPRPTSGGREGRQRPDRRGGWLRRRLAGAARRVALFTDIYKEA